MSLVCARGRLGFRADSTDCADPYPFLGPSDSATRSARKGLPVLVSLGGLEICHGTAQVGPVRSEPTRSGRLPDREGPVCSVPEEKDFISVLFRLNQFYKLQRFSRSSSFSRMRVLPK